MGYKIECKLCLRNGRRSQYFGESGYNGYWRGKFHIEGLEKRKEDNVLYEHNLKFHPEGTMTAKDFSMTVTGIYPRPLMRQCQEGLAIGAALDRRDRGDQVEGMNSKKEFLQPGTIRPRFEGLFQA